MDNLYDIKPLESQIINYVNNKERLAFYFSAMFRDMSYAIMAFLSYYYVDVMGLPGFGLSLVMIISRFWDGINDPIIGVYFDKSVSKEGKAIPFLRKTAIPISILIIMIFYSPTFSSNPTVNTWIRIVYALVTYVIFEGLHTLNGTSFMSLYNSITPNVQEKGKVISISRLFSTIGTAIAGGGIPILLGFFSNDDVLAKTYIYFGMGVFVGICFLIYNFLMVKYVKERVLVVSETKQDTKNMFKIFVKNKLLLLMIISNSIGGLINAGNTGLWFYTYNMGNPALFTYVQLGGFPTLILGTLLVPHLMKKYDKSKIMIVCFFGQVAVSLLFLAVGYPSIWFVVFIFTLQTLPQTIRGVLYWSMITDTVDYSEWKTGKRNDGMVFAIEGFLGKCIGSFGAVSTVIIIAIIGFVPNALTQSESTMKGLFYVPLIISIVSTLLSVIPYFFFKFSRKDHEIALAEIKARKELQIES